MIVVLLPFALWKSDVRPPLNDEATSETMVCEERAVTAA